MATKKAPAKKATKKAAVRKTVAKKAAAKKVVAKKAVKKAAKKTPAKRSAADRYTNPALRERLKNKIMAGDKGGKPGQWSARKAQLLAAEYEKAGGKFKGGKDEGQQSLTKWGAEKWHTADNKKAVRKGGTARYLPDAAWKKLTAAQKRATDKKKREGSRKGKQFVANTEPAKEARREATE